MPSHQLFGLPIYQAAERLGSSVSFLTKQCRSLGVTRWPFRKVRSLGKSLARSEALEKSLADTLELLGVAAPREVRHTGYIWGRGQGGLPACTTHVFFSRNRPG